MFSAYLRLRSSLQGGGMGAVDISTLSLVASADLAQLLLQLRKLRPQRSQRFGLLGAQGVQLRGMRGPSPRQLLLCCLELQVAPR